jgi:putative hydrolase of HD superfamily
MSQFSSVSSTNPEKLKDYIKFLKLVGKLKHVKRTGWVLRDVKDPESIASHMYRMSLMPFLLDKDSDIDREKSIKMGEFFVSGTVFWGISLLPWIPALIHDLAESVVGDITPFCNISKEEKQAKEEAAMKDICQLVGEEAGKEIMELFVVRFWREAGASRVLLNEN